jgi:hypothetical protein
MSDCNPVKTSSPLPNDMNLSLMDSFDEVDPNLQSMYKAIVGSQMFLYQWACPGLAFVHCTPQPSQIVTCNY